MEYICHFIIVVREMVRVSDSRIIQYESADWRNITSALSKMKQLVRQAPTYKKATTTQSN